MSEYGQPCVRAAILGIAVGMLAAMVVLAFAPVAFAEEGQVYHVAVSELNVRSEPDADARVVWTRIWDDLVTATGRMDGQWMEVCIDGPGYTGWVYWLYLSLEEPYSGVVGVITANGRVRFRDAPAGGTMEWLQPGREVVVLAVLEAEGTRWYRVQMGSGDRTVRGWVAEECLVMQQ